MARVGFSRAKTTRLQSFAKAETRDMTAASGDVAYTGYGLKPSCLIVFAYIEAEDVASWGMCDSSKGSMCMCRKDGLTTFYGDTINLIFGPTAAGIYQVAVVKSLDTDGYTLTWAKSGAPPAGTLLIRVLALR